MPTSVKRTRIVATLGPACDDETTLRAMIRAGLDVVRVNFSHQKDGTGLAERLARIRAAADAEGRPVAILGDLRGPRIRVGEMTGGAVTLTDGATVTLTPRPVVGTTEVLGVTFPALAGDVVPGATLLLDDGNLRLVVLDLPPGGDILCRVARGGLLSSNRGVNLPGRRVSLPSLTPKDLEDVSLAVEHGLDFVALSFVQSVEDVRGLKRALAERGADIPIIAKIEKKAALDDIEAIATEAYGVMVARGDLALEMSLPEVPIAQKRIISVCRRLARPVITATQMLESMTTAPKPTRAEATDVANAVFDGTDAVMLSGESAIGKFPVETVAMMSAIAARAEEAWLSRELPGGPDDLPDPRELGATVARAAWEIAVALGARVVVTHTTSGSTTLRVACHRPAMALLALCEHESVRRRLALCWGVESALTEPIESTTHMVTLAQRFAANCCGAAPGENIVIVAGTPYRVSGRTNLIKVATIPPAGMPAAAAGSEG